MSYNAKHVRRLSIPPKASRSLTVNNEAMIILKSQNIHYNLKVLKPLPVFVTLVLHSSLLLTISLEIVAICTFFLLSYKMIPLSITLACTE